MIRKTRILSTEIKRRIKMLQRGEKVNIFSPITPVILVKTKGICRKKNNNSAQSIPLLLSDQRIEIGPIKMSLEMNEWFR